MRIFTTITTAFMKNFVSRICAILPSVIISALTILLSSCTPSIDNTLGEEIMPENQAMVMRHLKFKGNNIIRYNQTTGENEESNGDPSYAGKNFFESRQFRTDSVISSNLDRGYFGVRKSDTLGLRSAGFASSIIYMNEIDKENGWGYMPIFDTMKLLLSIDKFCGDTLVPIKYNIYELKKPLLGDVLNAEDSTAYINCDMEKIYNEAEPIFTFTFPNSEAGEGPATAILTLDPVKDSNGKMSKQTWDYIRRLMLIPEDYNAANSDWDGYGREGIEIYQDEKKWIEKFHGIYIKPDLSSVADLQGAMYATKLDASGLMLQGRSRNPKEPSMILDTLGMYYYFYDEYTTHNLSATKVERDYSQGRTTESLLNKVVMDETKTVEERDLVGVCHIEGLGGSMAEITFTNDILDEFCSLLSSEGANYSKMGINQCLMTLYLDKADYDWSVTQGNYVELTPKLEQAFDRVGTYTSYSTVVPILDYDYVYENKYNTELAYNGYLDRSRGCYILNITGYIQRLFRYANETAKNENGGYDFDKSDTDYTPRTIYIGTKATEQLDFSIVTIQGMDNGTNRAPIQLDLTYTLVK